MVTRQQAISAIRKLMMRYQNYNWWRHAQTKHDPGLGYSVEAVVFGRVPEDFPEEIDGVPITIVERVDMTWALKGEPDGQENP